MTRLRSLLALALLGLSSGSCADPSARPTPPPPLPPLAGTAAPPAAPLPVFLLPPPAPPALAADRPDPGPIFEPSAFTLVVEDPRLAAVRAALAEEAPAKAVAAMEAALGATGLSDGERAAWSYQLGRLRAAAGDPLGAARAFDTAASLPSPLADHARYRAAAILEEANQHQEALSRARGVSAPLALADELELVIADSLAGSGDIDSAAPAYRSYLGRSERPRGFVPVTLRFAKALLAHPSEEHAAEAVRLARRVLYEGPSGAGAAEAQELERAALATLPVEKRRSFESPTQAELLARAKSLLESRQLREALRVTEALTTAAQAPGAFACDVWLTRASALSELRKKPEAADAYGTAISRCEGQAGSPKALFAGAKASSKAGRIPEAAERFLAVETKHPTHSYADDARFLGARARRAQGELERFRTMLATMPDAYPGGDMVTDGLFELALSYLDTGDYRGAIVPLERAYGIAPRERAYDAAGRLPYFLGRSLLATGETERGNALLARVIADHPLSYYMALAHARLAEQDPVLAQRILDAALAREPQEAPAPVASPLFGSPAFLRAALLAQQGEAELARDELSAMGAGKSDAPSELTWAAAVLLSRAGEAGFAHRLLRASVTPSSEGTPPADFALHYPVGPYRAGWELAYPTPYLDIVDAETTRSGIPKSLAYAIMREESAFDPRVVSPANAHGLMQLIVPTAKRMAKPLGLPGDAAALKKPAVNVALGCRYLSVLRKKFSDNPLLAIPGYNAGGGAPARWAEERPNQDFDLWVERIPYEETRLYTKRVIGSMAAYEVIWGFSNGGEALRAPLAVRPAAKAQATASAAGDEGALSPQGEGASAGDGVSAKE